MDTQSYLKRITYKGSTRPTPTTLRALHHAHLLAVPFENYSIHIGERIALSEKWLWLWLRLYGK